MNIYIYMTLNITFNSHNLLFYDPDFWLLKMILI